MPNTNSLKETLEKKLVGGKRSKSGKSVRKNRKTRKTYKKKQYKRGGADMPSDPKHKKM
jgi:hypothetical protein